MAAQVDGIEHCTCLTPNGVSTNPGLAEQIASAGTSVCPTLGIAPGVEPGPRVKAMMKRTGTTREGRMAQVTALHRAGVTLVSGADSGISPGKPHGVLPVAVAHLVECGLSAQAALASATSVAAKACGLAERTGRLEVGLDADLLVVDGNPTRDILALRRVRAVVSRGREVSPAETASSPAGRRSHPPQRR